MPISVIGTWSFPYIDPEICSLEEKKVAVYFITYLSIFLFNVECKRTNFMNVKQVLLLSFNTIDSNLWSYPLRQEDGRRDYPNCKFVSNSTDRVGSTGALPFVRPSIGFRGFCIQREYSAYQCSVAEKRSFKLLSLSSNIFIQSFITGFVYCWIKRRFFVADRSMCCELCGMLFSCFCPCVMQVDVFLVLTAGRVPCRYCLVRYMPVLSVLSGQWF